MTITTIKNGDVAIASVRAAMQAEIDRRVRVERRRAHLRIAMLLVAVCAVVLIALAGAEYAAAAADPVDKGINKFMAWGAGLFGVFCAFKSIHALMDEKFTKFFGFAGAALVAVPFVFSPDTVEKVGKQVTSVVFGV